MCDQAASRQCGCQGVKEDSTPANYSKILHLQEKVLAKNSDYAARNRTLFRHLCAINLLSSPGAGKTTLIQRLLTDLAPHVSHYARQRFDSPHADVPSMNAGVIVGDLATDRDAQRLRQFGVQAVQINTGNLCHLEAESVAKATQHFDLDSLDLLIIENVGNLVCPVAYDLGEDLRIVLMSVTEGEDKPYKYPTMFKSAQAIVISKSDLAEAVNFNRSEALQILSQVAPQAKIFVVSARTGQGLRSFYAYLEQAVATKTNQKEQVEVGQK